jgi:uncharacterized repeat protein (TIGR03803 family)
MLQPKSGCSNLAHRLMGVCLALVDASFFLAGTSHPAQCQSFSVIHNFTGNDGSSPYAGPTLDRNGHVYGTTYDGGTQGAGSVYKLSLHGSSWLLNPLYSFSGEADGAGPGFGALAIGSDGTLFGTTEGGGIFGVAFNLGPRPTACASLLCPWIDNVIHTFGRSGDGSQPVNGVVFDSAGNLYGTLNIGGAGNNGAVYEMTRSGQTWNESVIYSFTEGNDGGTPVASVSLDAAGNLYGTTSFGGANGVGVVYKLSRSGSGWTETVLYTFQGANDGQNPVAGVTVDQAGNLYGATFLGGANNGGTLYKLSPSGGSYTFALLYSFPGFGGPYSTLTLSNGNLYGTTNRDGAFSDGSVFKLTPNGSSWTFTDLYDFTGSNDGNVPYGGVAVDAQGDVFGTTSEGGSDNDGVVWEITP